jgi:hypothetical protein
MKKEIRVNNVSINVIIPESLVEANNALDMCLEIVNRSVDKLEDARIFAAQKYLKIYNNSWADEGDELDQNEFVSNLDLCSIRLSEDLSRVYMSFKDNQMFDGHAVLVTFEKEIPIYVELSG